jgi:hypothetical protein
MTFKSNEPFKPGDDFILDGVAKVTGITDFTGYNAYAAVKQRDDNTGEPIGDVLGSVGPVALDAAGTFRLTIAKEVTVDWPTDTVLAMDVAIVAATGEVTTSATEVFETAERVTVVPP